MLLVSDAVEWCDVCDVVGGCDRVGKGRWSAWGKRLDLG